MFEITTEAYACDDMNIKWGTGLINAKRWGELCFRALIFYIVLF